MPPSSTSLSNDSFYRIQSVLYKHGDETALERVLSQIEYLLVMKIKQINPNIRQDQDLFKEFLSIAKIAVWKSLKGFSGTKGIAFTTYALRAVQNTILDYIYKEDTYTEHHALPRDSVDEDNVSDFERLWYQQSESTVFWDWVNTESTNELVTILEEKLTGNSRRIFDYKREGYSDEEIRIELGVNRRSYQGLLHLFKWRASLILTELGFSL